MPKLRPHQVGQAGEHYVAAELHRRGAYAVTFSGNMPMIDVLASDAAHTRRVVLQVKTKTSGTWHASVAQGAPVADAAPDDRYWILVDIGRNEELPPSYFVVPEWWIREHIHDRHAGFLALHEGRRPRNPTSTHFAIHQRDVERWRDRWRLLQVFETPGQAAAGVLYAKDGAEHEIGPSGEVEEAMAWLSDLAGGGSGGGRWSHLLGDFVSAYEEEVVFERRHIDDLAEEAADLLNEAGSRIPAAAKRVLTRIAEISPQTASSW